MSLTKRLLEDDADGLIRYVRVVLIDGAGFYLKVQKETDQFLKGIEVDREGEDISRPGTFDQRVRLIQKSMIRTITPKKMNLHYGILEAAAWQKTNTGGGGSTAIINGNRWTVRRVRWSNATMFWLYKNGSRFNLTGSYEDSVSFPTEKEAQAFAERQENLHYLMSAGNWKLKEGIGNWYYNLAPGTPVSTVAKLWASEGKKAYDDSMPQDYNPDELWPYREFTRDVGVSYDPSIKASLMANGWQSDRPCHISLGRDGSIKVGEGNHRLALSRILGITKVPVVFHFQDRA